MHPRCNSHVRDSPGPRLRSTASIDGCTSSVGSGSSGSTSSSSGGAVFSPRPTAERLGGGGPCPEENNENTDELRARWPGTKGCCWLGDGVIGAGESIESSPAESEDERPCEPRRAEGPPDVEDRDWALREEVMSMLPPPTALRLRRRVRRRLRFRAWSGEEGASGSGVMVREPSSWAYA